MSSNEPNKNQELIDGLRRLADFLEAHPDLTRLDRQTVLMWASDKAELKLAARQLGSFRKVVDEYCYKLVKEFGPLLKLEVAASRERICKKIVTWDCPDDEALLRELTEAAAETEGS